MSKDEILERYLNTVYFGNGVYGVQAAAELYFGKNVSDLDWPEAALLAALIRDPRDYDPFTNPSAGDRAAPPRAAASGRHRQPERRARPISTTSRRCPTAPSTARRAAEGLLRRPGEAAAARRSVVQPRLGLHRALQRGVRGWAAHLHDTRSHVADASDRGSQRHVAGTGSERPLRHQRRDARTRQDKCPQLNDGNGHCLGTIAMVSIDPVDRRGARPRRRTWVRQVEVRPRTQAITPAGFVDEGVRARDCVGEVASTSPTRSAAVPCSIPNPRRHAEPVHAAG